MSAWVHGLDAFGLDLAGLKRLGDRSTRIQLHLETYDLTPSILALRPSERNRRLAAKAARWMAAIHRRFPERQFEIGSVQTPPAFVDATVAAREVPTLAAMRGVSSVGVSAVEGLRRRKQPPALEWYCVRALVVVEVEGKVRGVQTTEDRFVLLKASSFKDAERRLRPQWREYAQPYLNSEGEQVRWKLEKVVDVYATGDRKIDPRGAEVYSKLSARRMKPVRATRRRNK
jgi:hypothetical protein